MNTAEGKGSRYSGRDGGCRSGRRTVAECTGLPWPLDEARIGRLGFGLDGPSDGRHVEGSERGFRSGG